ncbi:hypothetical protein EsH8_IV_000061 [Colletotrichum jinshuiense]
MVATQLTPREYVGQATPKVLRLPDELLLSIFELAIAHRQSHRRELVPILRLTCRRFRDISSHLLLDRTTVDISRPETIDRFRGIAQNPSIACGVRSVYLRLHFYHPTAAQSIGNFARAIRAEWEERLLGSWGNNASSQEDQLNIDDIMGPFWKELDNMINSTGIENCNMGQFEDTTTTLALREAYALYKARFDSQSLMPQGKQFAEFFAEAFASMVNVSSLTIFDGDIDNNHAPGAKVKAKAGDREAHHRALVEVLSRPMLWEDVRQTFPHPMLLQDINWVGPPQQSWSLTPLGLLIDIPTAIGKRQGVRLDYLSIHLTAAPDYTLLIKEPESLRQLSTSIQSMDLFQFQFKPCTHRSVDLEDGSTTLARTGEEMRALNQYLGAIMSGGSIAYADINLGEFWYSLGVSSVFNAPASLGVDFHWPRKSKLQSILLVEVVLTVAQLQELASSLNEGSEFRMHMVRLTGNDTWREALDVLRLRLIRPQSVSIKFPLVDDFSGWNRDAWKHAFHEDPEAKSSGYSRADRFVAGDDIPNPLASVL